MTCTTAPGATSPYFYQLLRTMGVFPGDAPAVAGSDPGQPSASS